ncbi:MAG: alpha/beta hydrolase family protein [Rhodoglobus sp.]|nr:alpha/beta hydrolase family protein [Rhodoglobus sp.]
MTTPPTTDRWDEPTGATPRGTIIVLAGRGESPAVYSRFGRRLSADAYRVRAVRDVTESVAFSAQLVRSLVAESEVGPVVLVGSDAGAVLALRIASDRRSGVAAVVTAGLPRGTGIIADEYAQLDVRTACPVHRQVLANPELADPRALARDLPDGLTLPRPGDITVPLLALHGSADVVATTAEALSYYDEVPRARVAIVDQGLHDILNDVTHRSVAASIVLFLEELRNGGVPTIQVGEAARS